MKYASRLHGSLTKNYKMLVEAKRSETSLSRIPKNVHQFSNHRYIEEKQHDNLYISKDEYFAAIVNMGKHY